MPKCLVTTDDRKQYEVERDKITFLDDFGRPTKHQATMVVLPVLKPRADLVFGDGEGNVMNLGEITGVIWKRN